MSPRLLIFEEECATNADDELDECLSDGNDDVLQEDGVWRKNAEMLHKNKTHVSYQ